MITTIRPQPLIRCLHCQTPYEWRKSSSTSLKMTFCGFMCEKAHSGFTIEDLLRLERAPRGE